MSEPTEETTEPITREQLEAELNSWRTEAQAMNRLLLKILDVTETLEDSPLAAVRAYGDDLRRLFNSRRSL